MFYYSLIFKSKLNGTFVFIGHASRCFRSWNSFPASVNPSIKTHACRKFSMFNKKHKTSIIKSRNMSGSSDVCTSIKITDYDCIGFDLDNTLCSYNLIPLIQMEYKSLMRYLCENKGYPKDLLDLPLLDSDMSLLQRGLMLDLKKGNILKVNFEGTIVKACHGLKEMSEEDIVRVYGQDKQWEVSVTFCQDMVSTWNGPLAAELRTLLDYFDISASLVFARIVDYTDKVNGKVSESYAAGAEILAALVHQYKREHFQSEECYFFKEMKANQSKYVLKCDDSVVKWLKEIKKTKVTFLLTGSNIDFATFTAEYCLGKDWKDLFDIVICYARKPGFFFNNSPFIAYNGFAESGEIKFNDLVRGEIYCQGNWKEMIQFFSKLTGKSTPKCLYFGDNLVQDVYAPRHFCGCDTVAVIEELNQEQLPSDHQSWLNSDKWGSYFRSKDHYCTIWGNTITKYSKICIPNINYIANIPLDSVLQTFSNNVNGDVAGFHPTIPVSLKS